MVLLLTSVTHVQKVYTIPLFPPRHGLGMRLVLYIYIYMYMSSQDKATALFYASRSGHVDIVRVLLERGADPNIPDKVGI